MDFQKIYDEAIEAGKKASKEVNPTLYGWYSADLDGNQLSPTSYAPDCGGAYLKFAGNTAWGRWAKKNVGAKKDVYVGLTLSVKIDEEVRKSPLEQSAEVRAAAAHAAADVLRSYGIKCSVREYLT